MVLADAGRGRRGSAADRVLPDAPQRHCTCGAIPSCAGASRWAAGAFARGGRAAAARAVAPGGCLVHLTCSIEGGERRTCHRLLAAHGD
jgi:hypothetical protein